MATNSKSKYLRITKKEEDDDDSKPLTCNSSKFHKKVCDWLDWTQEPYDNDQDTKAEVKEERMSLDNDRIKFGASCPAPKQVAISYAGVTQMGTISYQNYCEFFIKLKPLLMGVAGIISVMIIAGRRM